jgi:gliding motility-associated-like protein
LSYHWLLNNQYLNNAKDSIFLAKEKGEYSVEVSFKNKCSRKSKSKITQIRFHTLPVLKLSPNNPSVCIGKIIKIQAPVNSNYTYQWLFENNPMIGFTKPYIEASNLGKYQIHITENTNNCTIKDSVILTGNPLPQITLNPQSVAVCENKNVEIKSTISNNQNNTYRYIWYINNTFIANETSPNISNNSKGKYKITVKDQKNCEASDSVQISNLNLPLVTFVKPDVVCGIHKQNILLKGLPANGTFEGTGVKGNTFNPSISKAGSFNINYYFTDSYGCTGKASQNILVENIKIDMPEKITVYEKEPKKIVNKVNQSNLSFEWSPTENLNDNRLQHPTAQIIDKNQTFSLKATSIHGCYAEDTVHLILDKRIRIPTIFTPNNDNINDELDIYGYDFFPDFQIDIFNRWGELVFSSKGYEEKFKGKNLSQIDLPQDTYCYKIKLGENRSDIQGVFVLKR